MQSPSFVRALWEQYSLFVLIQYGDIHLSPTDVTKLQCSLSLLHIHCRINVLSLSSYSVGNMHFFHISVT